MSSRGVSQDGVSGGMHLPRQPCCQTIFHSTKVPRTPSCAQRMIWLGNCYEDKLWERDVCSGSKMQQAQPESKPTVPKSDVF